MVNISFEGFEAFRARVGKIAARLRLNRADMQAVGEAQRLRIIHRTEQRHADKDNRVFHPYSRKGPYYYYPWRDRLGAGASPKQRHRSAARIAGLVRRAKVHTLAGRSRALGVQVGGVTPGGAVKFESYADFKASLGRTGVDLEGPHARMMRQLVTARTTHDEVHIGIYGEAAERAMGHQDGNPARKLPRRAFLGASTEERKQIATDMSQRLTAKIKRKAEFPLRRVSNGSDEGGA